jgi:hypothetical protein
MDEAAILSALQKGVTAAVAASSTSSLPVSYIGVNFAVPASRKYLEVVWIPNNRMGDYWGEEKNHQGLFRIVLHWPNDGGGPYAPLNLLASIAAYFTKGRLLSGVQIYEKPDLSGSPIADGDEWLYPATIRYQSFRRD